MYIQISSSSILTSTLYINVTKISDFHSCLILMWILFLGDGPSISEVLTVCMFKESTQWLLSVLTVGWQELFNSLNDRQIEMRQKIALWEADLFLGSSKSYEDLSYSSIICLFKTNNKVCEVRPGRNMNWRNKKWRKKEWDNEKGKKKQHMLSTACSLPFCMILEQVW